MTGRPRAWASLPRARAYLRCEVWPLLGVRSWEEVAWGAIPGPAQENLSEALPAAS